MAEPIKVGDLVMKIRTCCEKQRTLNGKNTTGVPFVVERIEMLSIECSHCGWGNGTLMPKAFGEGIKGPVSWLKRIPPLGELDDVKQDEEITA